MEDIIIKQAVRGAITNKLLELKAEINAQCGNIVKITFDKVGNEALCNELGIPVSCNSVVFGIAIDQVEEGSPAKALMEV